MASLKRMTSFLLIGAGVLIGLVLLVVVVGFLLPSDHVARTSVDLAANTGRVWALVSDLGGTGRWRSEVETVEALEPSPQGRERYAEKGRYGRTPFEVVSRDPPVRQVVRVVDEGLPFGGTWTWELAEHAGGTRLTITEEGFIRNPVFRVMSRLVFSPTATMEAYLRALVKELGEDAEPTVLRAR